MSEDVYVNTGTGPDLTKNIRYGRRERQMEMEERGEREEDIYLTPDDRDPIYVTVDELDPGTQQDAAQNNTAQEQHGGCEESKQNGYIAAAVCVGLLCLLLLAGIIALVIFYCVLIKEKHNLQSSFDELQTRHDNMTGQKEQWNTRFDKLQTRLNNMTEQKDKLQTSFDELETRHNNLKRILCESHGFTFGGGVCYYLSTEMKTWNESRTYCTARQSDLIIINSKEKQDFVVSLNRRMWLGLSDRETEGTFTWVDGTALTTAYWHPNEPNDDHGEDCVEMYSFMYNGRWNDRSCSLQNYWICEIVI